MINKLFEACAEDCFDKDGGEYEVVNMWSVTLFLNVIKCVYWELSSEKVEDIMTDVMNGKAVREIEEKYGLEDRKEEIKRWVKVFARSRRKEWDAIVEEERKRRGEMIKEGLGKKKE